MREGGRTLGARDFGSLKAKQLFEILLTARGRPVSKDRLCDLLWGDELPENNVATLESYVSVLRRRLAPKGVIRESVVVTDSGAYRIDTDKVQVDLDAFDRLVAEARGETPQRALALLRDASALVHGAVLEDELYAEWLQPLRDSYRRQVTETLVTAARLALDLGDPAGAVGLAELTITTDSLAEEAYQVAMIAFYRLGRQAEAVRVFRRCRQTLSAHLKAEPMRETIRLHAAVQAHDDDVLLPARPVRTSTRPMIGRDNELTQLEGLVRGAAAPRFDLVLVRGDAGIGKSRLLDELATHLDDLTVVRWRCSELDAHLPFLAITGALRNLGGDTVTEAVQLVDPSGPAPSDTPELLDRLATQVARYAPFVLLIDRLDLADTQSISALGYLQRRLADTAVTVIATSRSAPLTSAPLSHLDWRARIRLDRLTEDDLASLNVPGLLDLTGGHPVLVAGHLDSGSPEVPEHPLDVRDWVLAWCHDAGEAALPTLTAAAGLPQPFDPELLASVLECGAITLADELSRLCQHGLLVEKSTGFAFRDPPVRQILLDSMSTTYRLALTKGIGEAEEMQQLIRASTPPLVRRGRDYATEGRFITMAS